MTGPSHVSRNIVEALEPRVCLSIVFRAPIQTPIGPQLRAAAGDLNGDGKPDLIAEGSDGKVRIFPGRGDGTFLLVPAQPLPAGPDVTGIALGDFNRDGKLDLVFSNGGANATTSGNISIFLGNGNGTFAPPTFVYGGGDSRAIAATDFNRDGKLDLFVANAATWTASVMAQPGYGAGFLVGRGDGTFVNAQRIPLIGPQHLVAVPPALNATSTVPPDIGVAFGGDLDSSASQVPRAMIYTVKYAFTNALPIYSFSPFEGAISGLAVGDLNRDGRLDLAAEQTFATNASWGDASVHTFVAQNNGTFAERANVPTVLIHAAGLSVVDLDRNGRLDVVVTGEDARPLDIPGPPGMLIALPGNGDGSLGAAYSVRTFPVPTSQWVADLNRDGLLDIVTADQLGATSLLNASPRVTGGTEVLLFGDRRLRLGLDELI